MKLNIEVTPEELKELLLAFSGAGEYASSSAKQSFKDGDDPIAKMLKAQKEHMEYVKRGEPHDYGKI